MESLELSDLWSTAAILAGFQVVVLAWRIKREIAMEAEGARTWVTLADGFVALSFLVLVLGVFAGPVLKIVSADIATKIFGGALLLFAPYPFVLAAHYNLLGSWGGVTKQECVTAGVAVAAILSVIAWVIFFAG